MQSYTSMKRTLLYTCVQCEGFEVAVVKDATAAKVPEGDGYAAVAMRGGLTLTGLGIMHHAFPTISEAFFWACADIPPDPMLGLVVLAQRA